MKLGLTEETFSPAEDHRWLGSKHAWDTAKTITLDASAFAEVDFGDVPDGVVPSGVVVAELEGGLYGPATGDNAAGHLLTTKDTHGFTVDTPAALMWHGSVIVDNLPEGHGLTASAASALAQVHYTGDVPADPEG
jgi:hypothetical protein